MFSLGDQLYKGRLDAGLTQQQAADILGVSRQQFGRWENADDLKVSVFIDCCLAMGMDVESEFNVALNSLVDQR